MDMSKYKPLFLSETAEHLDGLESELIALDEKGGDIGPINEVFRHLHSIKSMAASMAYTPLATLAHKLEDMVAPHRESATAVESREIDILLRGLDELRQMLQCARSDKPLPSISPRLNAEIEKEAGKRNIHGIENNSAPAYKKKSAPSWTIQIRFSSDCHMPGVRAFMALRRLAQIGDLEKSYPTSEELKKGKLPDGKFEVTINTEHTKADLHDVLKKIPYIAQVDIEPSNRNKTLQTSNDQTIAQAPLPAEQQTVRVKTRLLDFFVNSIGELITLRSFFEDLSSSMDNPSLNDGVRRMGTVIHRLQEKIMEVRMVSVSALTAQLPRVCRDLARRRSKQISLTIHGTDVELDRALVQALSNPLLHMLRNAVEHGIETPEQRREKGKQDKGSISINFKRQHDRVIIEMTDDGCGINEDRLLEKALELGILKSKDEISEQQRLDLIFEPGLSTKDDVTDVSGRGVGMDSVKETIQRLGGQITVTSKPGQGTTFVLDLPFTLAIIQILTVETRGYILALPASRVTKAMPLDRNKLSSDNSRLSLRSAGRAYQYFSLANLLGIPAGEDGKDTAQELVLIGDESKASLALGVDKLTGHKEAVLKPIGDLLHRIGPFSSSTVLGDGSPVLILDVDELVAKASNSEAHDEQKKTSIPS